jgi:hypothetical protein
MGEVLTRFLRLFEGPRKRQQRWVHSRQGYSREDFTSHFAGSGVDVTVAQRTWDALLLAAEIDGFKPHPMDSLLHVFGLADEDLDDDVVLPLLIQCGCRIPSPQETMRMRPVETVADLVHFVQDLKPRQE